MRIAFVHELWDAGATRCVRDLQRELGRKHEVTFFPRTDEDTADAILKELESFRPDLVHCHSFYSNLTYNFLPRVSWAYPTCFTIHDPRPIGHIDIACWDCNRNDWCFRCPLVPGTWQNLIPNGYLKQRVWR